MTRSVISKKSTLKSLIFCMFARWNDLICNVGIANFLQAKVYFGLPYCTLFIRCKAVSSGEWKQWRNYWPRRPRNAGGGLWGAQKLWHSFPLKISEIKCGRAVQISVHILVDAVSVHFSLPFFLFLVILNLHVSLIPALLTSLFVLLTKLTSGAYRPLLAQLRTFHGFLPPSLSSPISLSYP